MFRLNLSLSYRLEKNTLMIFDVSETRVDTMGKHCEWLFCTSHNLAACQKDPGKMVSPCEQISLMGYDGMCLNMSSKSLESMFWKVHRGQTFLVMFLQLRNAPGLQLTFPDSG